MTASAPMRWIAFTASMLLAASCPSPAEAHDGEPVDTVITGGTIYDGTGADGRIADIAVDDGKIVYIGPDAHERFIGERVIAASGLVVAPGFIDPHTHAGGDLTSSDPARRANLPYIFQGVTTVVTGNDGGGGTEIGAMAQAASTDGIGTNVAYLVGFGPIREAVLAKENRAPTSDELAQMEELTRQAFCEGAWGLSTGLYYVPQNYAATEEVIALAKVASEFDGYYDSHLRDESTYNITVTGAVNEAITIGREAGIAVHIAHIKALGPAVWGHSAQMIEAIETARASGQQITADQYPWTASGTRYSNALVPRWALEGGLDGLRERLSNSAERATIREEMIAAITRRGGADKLLVTGLLGDADIPRGKTLAQIAQMEGREPVDSAIATLLLGDARVASFNMHAEDISAFAAQEWVVTGSDGSTGHPRKYGSYPKAYRDFVVDSDQMSLARFIQRSSGQVADIIGLDGRGYLQETYAADIVIFDPATFAPAANYQSPRELSRGVRHLLVNGVPVITDGQHTEALPGQPLVQNIICIKTNLRRQILHR